MLVSAASATILDDLNICVNASTSPNVKMGRAKTLKEPHLPNGVDERSVVMALAFTGNERAIALVLTLLEGVS